jgi:hypothetical protein
MSDPSRCDGCGEEVSEPIVHSDPQYAHSIRYCESCESLRERLGLRPGDHDQYELRAVDTSSITEYVEDTDLGTGYTIRIERIDPSGSDRDLEREGYSSRFYLYTVFSDGQVWSDHDPHRLLREKVDGRDLWLHEEFTQLRERLEAGEVSR